MWGLMSLKTGKIVVCESDGGLALFDSKAEAEMNIRNADEQAVQLTVSVKPWEGDTSLEKARKAGIETELTVIGVQTCAKGIENWIEVQQLISRARDEIHCLKSKLKSRVKR